MRLHFFTGKIEPTKFARLIFKHEKALDAWREGYLFDGAEMAAGAFAGRLLQDELLRFAQVHAV